MNTIELNIKNVLIPRADIDALHAEAVECLNTVKNGTGAGNDFLGWVKLPAEVPADEIARIKETAAYLQKECEVVVSIGIGGSYLGAKAVIEALSDSFSAYKAHHKGVKMIFAGQNIGEDYLYELIDYLTDKKFGLIVNSKSGTTTEPAIAFRILRELLERNVGKDKAARLTVAITDAKKGALRQMADEEGYTTFVVPDNVGGRFSVLTPVGLLPIAVAGYDIEELLGGAKQMMEATASEDYASNPALLYAATRNALYRAGKKI